jgi:hypothetical protein
VGFTVVLGSSNEGSEQDGFNTHIRDVRSACEVLVRKILLMTSRHRLEGNNKMDAKEAGCYGVNWTIGWLM